MKRILTFGKLIAFAIAFILPFSSHCQSVEEGSADFLRLSNGFKQIKLGADIKKLATDKLAYLDGIDSLDADSCYKFCYKDENILYLGNGLNLDLVGFRTYKDKIVNIYLFFPSENGYAILKEFEANYGNFTASPGPFMYDWKANGITLSLHYSKTLPMGVAVFTCNSIQKQLDADNIQRKMRIAMQGKNLLGSL